MGGIKMRRAFIITATALLVLVRPAQTQTTSPEAMTAAKDLIEVMRAAEQLKTMMPMMMQQLKPAIVQGRPEVERDYDAILPQVSVLIEQRMNELTGAMGAIYATHFSVDEMRQLADFYRRPVGQKLLQVLPKIVQESMAVGQKVGQSVALEARDRMIDELRKRGHKI
jgi:hypothetical protein